MLICIANTINDLVTNWMWSDGKYCMQKEWMKRTFSVLCMLWGKQFSARKATQLSLHSLWAKSAHVLNFLCPIIAFCSFIQTNMETHVHEIIYRDVTCICTDYIVIAWFADYYWFAC